MSFFGFLDFTREGKGISKNAPKKREFIRFFGAFFRSYWKFLPVSLMYYLISLPIVTAGLANVGITNVARSIARDKHSFGLSDFFEAIRKNAARALGAGIVSAVIYAFLIMSAYTAYCQNTTAGIVVFGIMLMALLVFELINYYVWTLIITFGFGVTAAFKNSYKLVFLNPKGNFVCFLSLFAITAVTALIFVYLLSGAVKLVLLVYALLLVIVLSFPAFKFLLIQFCVFPAIKKHIIDPYYAEHPNEDIEKRRQLGVYDETLIEDRDFND